MRLNKQRRAGNRSSGGRPRSEGERYENGRLKVDRSPNPAVMALREKVGLASSSQPFTPMGVAIAHGWLDGRDIRTASAFIACHHAARVDGPKIPAQGDMSNPEAVDVRSIGWTSLSDAEIVAIWESALRDVPCGPSERSDAFAVEAMRRWKAACKAMTADQRREVQLFCIDDSWPQWVIQRLAGRTKTSWERQRTLLVEGLRAIAADAARPANDPAARWEGPDPAPLAPASVVERTAYVDEDENAMFTVERVTRRRVA